MANGVHDPNNPDVDNMTYEQLMELGENAGKVNKGCTRQQINSIRAFYWSKGKTKTTECMICMDKFQDYQKVKSLKCGHEYCQECIDKWLMTEKRCPVCNEQLF